MGTRADFYVADGNQLQWLGSVAWDGYEWHERGKECKLMSAKTSDEFRSAVGEISDGREDFTSPQMGWPWPWDDSRTTDYAYVWRNGNVEVYIFGHPAEDDDVAKVDWFPNMSEKRNLTLGERSGLIVFTAK